MNTYTVDVWFTETHPMDKGPEDWRRYSVEAPDPVTAELVATQMCYATHNYPVRSSVLF